MENEVVVKKGSCFWKIVGIVLAVAGVCLIAVKVYQKFLRKKKDAVEACEETPELEGEDEAVAEETFEVPAEAVIANAEDMAEEEN